MQTIIIESDNAEFIDSLKKLCKSLNINFKKKKTSINHKESSMERALRELKNGECESFKDFEEYKKAMVNV